MSVEPRPQPGDSGRYQGPKVNHSIRDPTGCSCGCPDCPDLCQCGEREPAPRYWDPREGSRIDDIDARLASYAQQIDERK